MTQQEQQLHCRKNVRRGKADVIFEKCAAPLRTVPASASAAQCVRSARNIPASRPTWVGSTARPGRGREREAAEVGCGASTMCLRTRFPQMSSSCDIRKGEDR